MRVSRAQAEANREAVINVASQLFRERGFDGIGLKELMKGAGLTQGGFYKQFESKDDLAALASKRAMDSAMQRWASVATTGSNPLQCVLDLYLSEGHREEKADGCPLVALGSDAARQSPEVREQFEEGIKAHLQLLEELMPPSAGGDTAKRAMTALSQMVGAVILSRLVTDEQLSATLLETAKAEITRIATSEEEA